MLYIYYFTTKMVRGYDPSKKVMGVNKNLMIEPDIAIDANAADYW